MLPGEKVDSVTQNVRFQYRPLGRSHVHQNQKFDMKLINLAEGQHSQFWSDAEIERLRELYNANTPRREIVDILNREFKKGRTLSSLQMRITQTGIAADKRAIDQEAWAKEYEQLINQPPRPRPNPASRSKPDPKRPKFQHPQFWSKKEIKRLNELYKANTPRKEIVDILNREFKKGRTLGSLTSRITQLGLVGDEPQRSTDKNWTKEEYAEVARLSKLYNIDDIAMFLDRSPATIKRLIDVMNAKPIGKTLPPELVAIVKKLWNKGSTAVDIARVLKDKYDFSVKPLSMMAGISKRRKRAEARGDFSWRRK